MNQRTKILLVDDHAVVRAGLKLILNDTVDLHVAAEAINVGDAIAALEKTDIDVVLLDLTLGKESGLDVLKWVKEHKPLARVLVLSAFGEDQYAVQTHKAGADGYLNKETAPDLLTAAVRRVASGQKYVSPDLAEKLLDVLDGTQVQPHERLSGREFEMLRMIASGKSLVSIAEELKVSTKTITTYRARLLEKMGLSTNAELVRYALERGLLR